MLAKDVHEVLKSALVNDPVEWAKQLKAVEEAPPAASTATRLAKSVEKAA